MKTPAITVGGRTGLIFEGEMPETYCFVPEDCIVAEGDTLRIAEGDYVRSGWDVRNMRFNDSGAGQHLFPDPQRPVGDLGGELVRNFVCRIQTVHAV